VPAALNKPATIAGGSGFEGVLRTVARIALPQSAHDHPRIALPHRTRFSRVHVNPHKGGKSEPRRWFIDELHYSILRICLISKRGNRGMMLEELPLIMRLMYISSEMSLRSRALIVKGVDDWELAMHISGNVILTV
jgi:hypothetical protein